MNIIITITACLLAVYFFVVSCLLVIERDNAQQALKETQDDLLDKEEELAYWKGCFKSMREERNALLQKFKLF